VAGIILKRVFQIKWYKGSKELDSDKFPITHTDGVITIEIINAQPGDSGKYKCVASNTLGSDSSDCVVIVEGSHYGGDGSTSVSSGKKLEMFQKC
jgi:hypothetical protein